MKNKQKFAVGDIVKSTVPVGTKKIKKAIGQVVGFTTPDSENQTVGVQFEVYIGGHSCNGSAKADRGWWCNPNKLVLIKKHCGRPFGSKKKAKAAKQEDQTPNSQSKHKFQVGDRVRAVSPVGGKFISNVLGTIIELSSLSDPQRYCVEFDEDIGGHNADIVGKSNNCWWVARDEIELTSEQKKKRGRPVGSKNKPKVQVNKQVIALPKDNSKDILDTLKEIKGLLEKLVEQKQPTFEELLKDFLNK